MIQLLTRDDDGIIVRVIFVSQTSTIMVASPIEDRQGSEAVQSPSSQFLKMWPPSHHASKIKARFYWVIYHQQQQTPHTIVVNVSGSDCNQVDIAGGYHKSRT